MKTCRTTVGTGTPAFAASLLDDLYVTLRRDINEWASVTHQTPQPRMGYVGQHLVSVVTGYPGGRSGARGDDLKLPAGKVAEIKCCYRVDQLGKCKKCGAAVASIETICPNDQCKSVDLVRNDDSKWLLSPKDEKELHELFIPKCYYLVLFEFVDLKKSDEIAVCIFQVDTLCLGFTLCMIDYYFNIRAKSASKAPFNLWPWSPKFYMMKPLLIYKSIIKADDTIRTEIFPGINPPVLIGFGNLETYSRTDMPETAIDAVAAVRNVTFPKFTATNSKLLHAKLSFLQVQRMVQKWDDASLADDFARANFRSKVSANQTWTAQYAPSL